MQVPRVLSLPGLTTGITNLAGLAAFVRARLGEVGGSLAPLLVRRNDAERLVLPSPAGQVALAEARRTIVGAAAPFAATAFARARLLRQMHACGLLSEDETEQAETLLGVAR